MASVREALDAMDRSEVKHRVLIAAVILGVIPVALWLDAALWKSPAGNNAINIRTLAVIVAMLTVATMKIRNEMSKNTRAILRAIVEFDSRSKRTS